MATRKFNKTRYVLFVLFIGLIIFSMLYTLPYYVQSPGGAQELDPIVEVDGGFKNEQGDFLFTTVQFGKANIYEYLYAKYVSEYHVLVEEDKFLQEGQSMEEFEVYTLHMMDQSQFNATYLAYEKAGKKPEVKHNGLLIVSTVDGMPADEKMKSGDRLISAADEKIDVYKDLQKVLKNKSAGDKVKLTVVRNDEEKNLTVEVGKYPEKMETDRQYGLGITIVPLTDLKVNPDIKFETKGIGGPSAGLMFSLEIYDQLTEGNMTKGYNIAGTGEINLDGTVGPIGGIKKKVVAADSTGADIFFAPQAGGNYKDAVQAAKDIETDMDIVPVKTIEDALDFLDKLGGTVRNGSAQFL